MILPEKYTNCATSIIGVAAQIIRVLDNKGPMTYEAVLSSIKKYSGENCKYEYQNALNFLFLLGKLNYYSDCDMLELIK